MAENSGNPQLEINIGADLSQLQASIIAAENELRGFQSEIKKTTDTTKIAELSRSIENTQQKIAGMRQEMGKSAVASDKAVNALGNVSRVAQDASYGFMGIANNLNPLFESFQRLQKESGGTGNALKAMGTALTGPAGIGLGIAVVSSLIVSFGDDLVELINKATGGSKAMVEFGKSFTAAKDAFSSAYVQMENLNSSFDQFHNGTKSKKSVLDEYNQSLGKVYGTTKDIAEAERLFIENKDNYVQAALYRAAGQIALKKAAEEAFKQLEAQNMPQTANKASLFMGEGIGAFVLSKLTGGPALTYTDLLGSKVIAGKAKEQESLFKGIFDQFQKLADEQDKLAKRSKDFGKDLQTPSPIVNYAREENKQLTLELSKMKALREQMKKIGLEPLKLFELPSDTRAAEKKRKGYFQGKEKDLLEESNQSGFGAYMQGLFKKDKAQIDAEEAEKKRIEELTKTYEQFAGTISQTVTGALFGMYDAMQQGASAGEALGQMFSRLLRQITEMVVQAAIFAGILSLISGGASNAAKGGVSFMGAFTKILGIPKMASGGIATGPTLAMIGEGSESEAVLPLSKLGNIMRGSFNVGSMNGNSMSQNGQFVLRGQDLVLAMQRSNSSLNIIRG